MVCGVEVEAKAGDVESKALAVCQLLNNGEWL